jgi:hypothetical protein
MQTALPFASSVGGKFEDAQVFKKKSLKMHSAAGEETWICIALLESALTNLTFGVWVGG